MRVSAEHDEAPRRLGARRGAQHAADRVAREVRQPIKCNLNRSSRLPPDRVPRGRLNKDGYYVALPALGYEVADAPGTRKLAFGAAPPVQIVVELGENADRADAPDQSFNASAPPMISISSFVIAA